MKATRAVGQAALALLSLSSAASAFSWPNWLPARDSLIARADQSSSSSSATQTSSATTASTTTSASSTSSGSSSDSITSTNLNTAGLTSSTSGSSSSGSGSTSGSTKLTTTSQATYNSSDGTGSIVFLTPDITSTATPLYRIGEYVTWIWNYTSLEASPTAIDLLVSCSTATESWTLTQNMSFAPTGSYTWDTGAYQSSNIASPLLTEMYTIIIYDAESSVSATADYGYLGVYSAMTFGLYTGKPYTPLSDWTCATCSGALSDTERRALGFAVVMSIVTVMSFTWFVAGFGAFV